MQNVLVQNSAYTASASDHLGICSYPQFAKASSNPNIFGVLTGWWSPARIAPATSWLDQRNQIDSADLLELHQLYRAMAWLGEELADQSGATRAARRRRPWTNKSSGCFGALLLDTIGLGVGLIAFSAPIKIILSPLMEAICASEHG